MIREWFAKLSIQERVLALSTVDPEITRTIKSAHAALSRNGNDQSGTFRMKSNKAEAAVTSKSGNIQSKPCWILIPNNSQAYKTSSEQAV